MIWRLIRSRRAIFPGGKALLEMMRVRPLDNGLPGLVRVASMDKSFCPKIWGGG
jgi:hypothetical protein